MRNLLIPREFHLVLTGTTRKRAQARGVIGYLGIRNGCLNGSLPKCRARTGIHAFHAASRRRNVTHHGSGIAVGNGDLKMSHRLKKYGFCLVNSLLETNAGGRLKCHLVGVHGVIAAFVYRNFDVDHGISRQYALTHGFLHALVDGRNEAAWNVASHHFIHKLIPCIGIRLNAKPAVAILSGTTGLLLMATLRACHAADGLTVWDAECHFMGAHPGTGFQTIKQHGYLRFTNGGDDRLSGILIALNAKRGVCGSGLLQKRKEFTLRTALVGLNGNAIERVGEAERRSFNLTRRRKRISRQRFKLGNHHDVSRSGTGHIGGLTAAHTVQMRKTLGLTCTCIDKFNTRFKRSCQYFQERQTTVLRILQ